MLSKLEIILEKPKDLSLNHNISSLFQGVLMENINEDYADELHKTGLKPYSQHIEFQKDTIKWIINTLTESAKEQIIDPIIVDELKFIRLEHKNLQLNILEKKCIRLHTNNCWTRNTSATANVISRLNLLHPVLSKVRGNISFIPI